MWNATCVDTLASSHQIRPVQWLRISKDANMQVSAENTGVTRPFAFSKFFQIDVVGCWESALARNSSKLSPEDGLVQDSSCEHPRMEITSAWRKVCIYYINVSSVARHSQWAKFSSLSLYGHTHLKQLFVTFHSSHTSLLKVNKNWHCSLS